MYSMNVFDCQMKYFVSTYYERFHDNVDKYRLDYLLVISFCERDEKRFLLEINIYASTGEL